MVGEEVCMTGMACVMGAKVCMKGMGVVEVTA